MPTTNYNSTRFSTFNLAENPLKGFNLIDASAGTGKTYIAEAIGLYACKMGYPAQKVRYKRLFDEIQAAKGTGVYLNYLRKLQKIKVLIIDDFAMQPITQDQLCDLMELIEERDQLGPVIITTQYPPNKWHSLFDDPTIADAICDECILSLVEI